MTKRPGSGSRQLKTRVKTARGRSTSSTRWLQRQLNDPYVARAKAEGWRSRAAFKLIEMNEKHHLLHPGQRIVDLGCAPGGWLQVAAKETGSTDENPLIVGIDYLEMEPVPGSIILQKDFTDEDAPDMLVEALGGHKVDLVLSDMAAPTTGHKATDHLRIIALVEMAADFACDVLKPGGAFVAKVFQGGTEHQLLGELKKRFDTTFHAKPPASRKDSAEAYLIAKGFKG
ncbi:MAG: RlmE family RNA methyltransferase [Hyphomicrobiaceae bacterium]|nr:RlmE family RNA methyltransferase [Hyphomicrobiaceae bacterium]MCC0024652.1 RlmE family RNA methyltransferase [Hyphomicrobiaceae bacterium]